MALRDFLKTRRSITTSKQSEPGVENVTEYTPADTPSFQGPFTHSRTESPFGLGRTSDAPASGAVTRRLATMAPRNALKTVYGPPSSVIPAIQEASAGAASPDVSLKESLAALQEPSEPRGPRQAIGRALQGFSRGFAATPATAGYNPIGAGIAGGFAGIGQTAEAEQARRIKAGEPARKAAERLLGVQLEETAKEPFRKAADVRDEARQKALEAERSKNRGVLQRQAQKAQATLRGVPKESADRYYNEAVNEIRALGMADDTPGFEGLVMDRYSKRLEAHTKARTEIPARPAAAKQAPKTADDYWKSIGGQ